MLITQVEGEKSTFQSQVQAQVVSIVNKARADANNKVTETQQMADVQIIQADSKLQATKAQYAALTEEGRAESANLDAFDAQRRHEYEMNKAKVYDDLARSQKHMVISGTSGDQLLSSIINLTLEPTSSSKLAKK